MPNPPSRFEWVILGRLARCSGPGYIGEKGAPVSASVVNDWMEAIRSTGVRSIICLLESEHLKLYEGDLLATFRAGGFEVAHVPAKDHEWPPLTDTQREKVADAFQALPKPVLVHCSAGMDRTGAAVNHLLSKDQQG